MVMTDGVHGTTLGPVEMLVLNVVLISFSFFLLCRPTQSAKREILVLTSITTAAAASRILLEPFPNVQPLTVMCPLPAIFPSTSHSRIVLRSSQPAVIR